MMFYCLLRDQANIIFDEKGKNLQIFFESENNGSQNSLDEYFMILQFQTMAKDKIYLQKGFNLFDDKLAISLAFLQLIFNILHFNIEPIAVIASQEMQIVIQDVSQDDRFLIFLIDNKTVKAYMGQMNFGVIFDYFIKQQENGQSFFWFVDVLRSLLDLAQIEDLFFICFRIEVSEDIGDEIALEMSREDVLGLIIEQGIVEKVLQGLHRLVNLLIMQILFENIYLYYELQINLIYFYVYFNQFRLQNKIKQNTQNKTKIKSNYHLFCYLQSNQNILLNILIEKQQNDIYLYYRFLIVYHQYLLQLIIQQVMDNDNSEMFNVDSSVQTKVKDLHLFNQETQIIKEGQKFKVVYGNMEQEKKSFTQIVSPYLHKFATTTAEIAAKAGSTTLEALKNGVIWVYNKFVNNVIPYAIENLPSILFIVKKQEKTQIESYKSSSIEILIDQEDYNKIDAQKNKPNMTRVVIPMGTQNDKHFQEFLINQKYEINYSFPIDIDESQQIKIKPAFMIPSESFELICQEVKEAHTQLQIQMPATYKKVAYRLNNCFIFELEGQNTIQYDMLDSIQKSNETKTGYIMHPQQTLRKSISESEMDPIAMIANGIEPQNKYYQEQKVVDRQRRVHVDITNKKIKPQNQFALN